MQKVRVPVNSFQFGEVSDSLQSRNDTPILASSASRVENFVVMGEGSLKKRHGLKHIYSYSLTYDANNKNQSFLASFVFDDNEQYVVSIEHAKLRFFRLLTDGTISLVDTVTADVSSAALPFNKTYINEYTYAQYGDVMFICHPLFAPRVITRTSLTNFDVSTFTFDARADGHKIYQPYYDFQPQGVTLDPSKTTGTGATLVTSAAYWTSDHVGTTIKYHDSEILITAVGSATSATGNVIDTLKIRLAILNPFRSIDGDATVEVTHLEHGFAGGETITVEEASAFGGINSGNLNGSRTVGVIIDDNTYTFEAGGAANTSEDGGGYVKLVTHAATLDWTEQAFSAVRGYPASVCFHENRLVFAGTLAQPDTLWFSKIGDFFNFDVDEAADNDSFDLTASTGQVNEIRYMISNRDLQVFTASGELYIPTYLNQAITPTNAQIRKQTPYGSQFVQPASIDGATVFVQHDGYAVREYLYTDGEDAYTAASVSTLSSHLIDDPQSMAVVHSGFRLPDSYAFFVSGGGDAVLFSSNRAEKRASWTRVTTSGRFAGTVAIHNRLFANVYDSYNKLQLCEFEGDIGLDMYLYKAISNNLVDVSDLYNNNEVVDLIATDGTIQSYLGTFTVNSDEKISLASYTGLGFTHAYVGKSFTSKIITNPIDVGSGNGPATGSIRGVANVILDLKDARSFKVNSRAFTNDTSFTGKKEVRILGHSRDPRITIEQNDPLPLQVNGLIAELII
tara:strand:- start:375 stop:2582 length:2208 start_codon:yes stop_codon:yes gene_type:complete